MQTKHIYHTDARSLVTWQPHQQKYIFKQKKKERVSDLELMREEIFEYNQIILKEREFLVF